MISAAFAASTQIVPEQPARAHRAAASAAGGAEAEGHSVIAQPHAPPVERAQTGPAIEPSAQAVLGMPGAGPHSLASQGPS